MTSLDNHLALVQWVTSNGGFCHKDIIVAHDSKRSFHLQVRPGQSISTGASLLRCPMKCVLTVLNALDTPPFSSHGSNFPTKFLHGQSPYVVQYFFLMEQFILGEQSWWAPYLRTLPNPQDLPEFGPFEKDDLLWISGTNLQPALNSQIEHWNKLYSEGLQSLKDLQWPSAIEGRYTWRLFIWAVRQFDSRSFTPELLADTLAAEKATTMGERLPDHHLLVRIFEESFSVLIPLLDLTSHQPLFDIDWKHNMNDIGIGSRQDLTGGVEVCNNYGPKDNETLLLAYSFTIPNNPFDIVLINIKAPPGSPLQEARIIWHHRSIDHDGPGKLHIMNTDHPVSKAAVDRQSAVFSTSLLSSISTLVANDREIKCELFQREQTMIAKTAKDNPFDWQRNLVATCAQLATECKARLDLLTTHTSRLGDALAKPSNSIQSYAKIYRDSQTSILESAYYICCYDLFRSRSDPGNAEQKLEHQMEARGLLKDGRTRTFDLIRSKPDSIIPEGIMFSTTEALAILDDTTRQGLEEALLEIGIGRQTENGLQKSTKDEIILAKIQFAVFVAYIDLQNGLNASVLSTHLRSWLVNLDRWYPTSNTELLMPTEELLPLLEPLLNVSPEDAWSQELICWAWSIVEEETVSFPVDDRKQQHASSVEVMLYVPGSE